VREGIGAPRVHAITNVKHLVKLTDDSAIVEVVTFTKWG